jgi:hypothetical protein
VLAHAGLATADMAQTGCLTAAFLAWLIWTGQPTWRRSVVCGVLTGLAVLAKFATCGFLPTILAIALAWYLLVEQPNALHLQTSAQSRRRPCARAWRPSAWPDSPRLSPGGPDCPASTISSP